MDQISDKSQGKNKPKLLLHICCIGCGAYVVELLKQSYQVDLYFYNPNIFPESEYQLRLEEIQRVAKLLSLKVLVAGNNYQAWLDLVKGHEADPERGGRCIICYRGRLSATARQASEQAYDFFSSTLTISPHKLAPAILQIGQELEAEFSVKFLGQDFKKNDGFKKSCELSRQLKLYRQDYCGCEFSIRQKTFNRRSERKPS